MTMPTALLASWLLASSPEPLSVAAPGLTAVQLDAQLASFYSEQLAQQLSISGLKVVSPKEISTLLSVERQKALLGCAENSQSCLAEISGALGTEAILVGEVGWVSSGFHLSARIVSARDAARLAEHSARVRTEQELISAIEAAANDLAEQVSRTTGRPLAPRSRGLRKSWAWGPAIAGAALAGGGGFLVFQANDRYRRLAPSSPIDLEEGRRLRDEGSAYQTFGIAALAASGVALSAALGLVLFGRPADEVPKPFVSASAGGVGVGLCGSLP